MRHAPSLILGILLSSLASTGSSSVDIAQTPVFLNPPDPRVMLIMSRDHELSKKAYTDYNDLNDNSQIDTTYSDSIDYYGYFNPKRCYTYNSSSSRFEPSSATTANTHQCSGEWSGNLLNWISMTRMDVLRKTLYGGYRSTDSNGTGALGDTVLERAMLPNDVHAFAKVFAPAGGATDVAKFVPSPYSSQASLSFCNVTDATTGMSRDTTVSPKILVANGSYPRWAMTEFPQCQTGVTNTPASTAATLTARVAVCVSGKLEDNCTQYGTNYKPTGLLQKYGEKEAVARVQFGLLTGSYSKNKSGGVLRKNTSWLTGNTAATNNEVSPTTGQFINQTTTDAGIINTINRIRISGYDFSTKKHQNSCASPGISSFSNGQCVDWGNPLAEMYLETLRYFSGTELGSGYKATAAFDSSGESTHLPSLPQVTWADPLPSDQWCALSNTVVISTGMNSFDGDELTGHGIAGLNAATLTTSVGTNLGLTGSYLIGSNGTTSDNQCTAKTLSDLSNARGICPEVPSLEGSYHLAGLAYANQSVDLRPSYKSKRDTRWGTSSLNPKAAYAARQPMATYAVALAESLPKFSLPVSGGNITFLPNCMANSTGSATAASSGWRVCSLTDLRFISLTTNGSNQPIAGTIEIAWEDSTWGNDYDMDGVHRISFCVGTNCIPAVGNNEIALTTQVQSTAAGHALRFGYTVVGSTADGASFPDLVAGGTNVSSPLASTAAVTFTLGSSTGKSLESPLYYAAKYGHDGGVATGTPDNYFKVTDPAKLSDALGKVFEAASKADASASAIASNSTRLDTSTRVYQAVFHSPGWYGEFKAFPLSSSGTIGTASWEAASLIPTAATRNIKTWNTATTAGMDFIWSSFDNTQKSTYFDSTESKFNYLRGDQTNEKSQGGVYRNRTTVMGDIVNSDPHYVAKENYGYDLSTSGLAAAEKAAYTVFRTGTKTSRKAALYVGANDGMLHAINADNLASNDGGKELFAYVPSMIIPSLKKLSDPTYKHQYYVDGSPNSGDAYLGSAWKTVLIGSLGAGGKGVFALDITDPDAFDATKVMWEFTDASDLGMMINSRAQIARLNDGKWYAIFGNGYNSANGKAVLFLVPLDNTSAAIKIDTGVGSDNGLSEPALLDTNGDRIVDVAYAGDLKGNLWKFDLSATSTNSWDSAYKTSGSPAPLFKASVSSVDQPITGAVEIGAPPAGTSGYMIYFGTGQYLGTSDVGTTATQSAYGILDSGTKITTGRSALQAQTFIYEGNVSSSNTAQVRAVSNNTVTYTGGSAKRGWYLDLLSPNNPSNLGERMVTVPLLRYGRIILTTIVPSAAACEQGGYSWITEVSALTGGRLDYTVFDLNGDNLFNTGDYVVNGSSTYPASSTKMGSQGLLKAPTVISAGEKEYKVGSGTAAGITVLKEKGQNSNPRTSWRQIFVP